MSPSGKSMSVHYASPVRICHLLRALTALTRPSTTFSRRERVPRGLRRGFDLQQGAVVFVGKQIEEAVGALSDIANTLVQIDQ